MDYPYELVNNLTTDDATKGLSAAQGVVLNMDLGNRVSVASSGTVSGSRLNSAGNEVTASGFKIHTFPVTSIYKNIEVQVPSGASQTSPFSGFYDANDALIGTTTRTDRLRTATIFDVPANAATYKVSIYSYAATSVSVLAIKAGSVKQRLDVAEGTLGEVVEEIDNTSNSYPSKFGYVDGVPRETNIYAITGVELVKGHKYSATLVADSQVTAPSDFNMKICAPDSDATVLRIMSLGSQTFTEITQPFIWENETVQDYRLGFYGNGAVTARLTVVLKDVTVDLLSEGTVNWDVVNRNKHKEAALVSVASYKGNTDIKTSGKLTLLHFSDLHGNTANLKDIVQYSDNYSALLDDTIHTGDTVANIITDTNPFTTVEGAGTILNVIGNHEAWLSTSESDYNATEKQTYDKIFAPSISGWGVTQPTGAAENGYCYYYKDYTTAGFRLIVLDSVHWHYRNGVSQANAAQKSWFEATLADARTQGLNVVCATHYTPQNGIIPVQGTGFNVLGTTTGADIADGWYAVDEMFGCVDAFMTAGGKFSGWIVGHTHNDYFGEVYGHSGQPIVVIGTSRGTGSVNNKFVSGTVAQDNFNVITFETLNSKNIVKIVKIGQDTDIYLRSKNTISYNFTDGILLATN